ncbi:MAG TPA: DUF2783 domain-containing protein [Solirubrobacteraceae bacterium]|nr:DUF2783 domain-containing protein [Solirubrobacteraceae bacterium]
MTLRWQEGDRIFERLTEAAETQEGAELSRFLARLVFLLANEIDDPEAVLAAIDAARRAGRRDPAG